MKKNSKIFVAGGTGLVGSAIIKKLIDRGYGNIVSNYHKRPPVSDYNASIENHHLDLTIQSEVDRFFEEEKPEYVFLAAARVGGIVANDTWKAEFIYDNIVIASNAINASYRYGVKKLLNLGSSCIYPKFAPQPMREEYLLTGELEPTNEPYAIAKIAAIKLCRYFNEQYGTNFISVMPTNLYGPNDNFDLINSHVLPALIRKFHLGKLLADRRFDLIKEDFLTHGNSKNLIDDHEVMIDEKSSSEEVLRVLNYFGISRASAVTVDLWGSGNPYREFLHVDDLADAVIYLMENYDYSDLGEFINIGTGVDLTVKELSLMIREIVGFDGDITFDTSKPDGTPRKLLDISRLSSLDWHSRIPLREGIQRVYEWYRGKK